MKCVTCSGNVSTEYAYSIQSNMCPKCGKALLADDQHQQYMLLLSDLKKVLQVTTDKKLNEGIVIRVISVLLDNYKLKRKSNKPSETNYNFPQHLPPPPQNASYSPQGYMPPNFVPQPPRGYFPPQKLPAPQPQRPTQPQPQPQPQQNNKYPHLQPPPTQPQQAPPQQQNNGGPFGQLDAFEQMILEAQKENIEYNSDMPQQNEQPNEHYMQPAPVPPNNMQHFNAHNPYMQNQGGYPPQHYPPQQGYPPQHYPPQQGYPPPRYNTEYIPGTSIRRPYIPPVSAYGGNVPYSQYYPDTGGYGGGNRAPRNSYGGPSQVTRSDSSNAPGEVGRPYDEVMATAAMRPKTNSGNIIY